MPLTPKLSSGAPTYNPGIAETFSWIPVENAYRPMYAKAVYSVNKSDNQGQNGFDFLRAGVLYNTNEYVCIHTITSVTFTELSASNSYMGPIGGGANTNVFQTAFPADFKLNGTITGVKLGSGAAIGYRA